MIYLINRGDSNIAFESMVHQWCHDHHGQDLAFPTWLGYFSFVINPWGEIDLPNLVMTFTVRHGFSMALIEIDGLPGFTS